MLVPSSPNLVATPLYLNHCVGLQLYMINSAFHCQIRPLHCDNELRSNFNLGFFVQHVYVSMRLDARNEMVAKFFHHVLPSATPVIVS